MSRTPNFHKNPYSGGMPSRSPSFSPYSQDRSPMGPPDGGRHGYFTPQQGECPMGGSPGMMPGQHYPSRNRSPFSPPPFYQTPYQQGGGGSSPHSPRGSGGGYHRRNSRGWGRGRGGRGGDHFTPTGHQQFQNRRRFSGGSPNQRGQYGGDNPSDIERYFKPSMLEDPWRDLESAASSSAS